MTDRNEPWTDKVEDLGVDDEELETTEDVDDVPEPVQAPVQTQASPSTPQERKGPRRSAYSVVAGEPVKRDSNS